MAERPSPLHLPGKGFIFPFPVNQEINSSSVSGGNAAKMKLSALFLILDFPPFLKVIAFLLFGIFFQCFRDFPASLLLLTSLMLTAHAVASVPAVLCCAVANVLAVLTSTIFTGVPYCCCSILNLACFLAVAGFLL
jgi:hypothetical protein